MFFLFVEYRPVGLKEAALDSPTFRATTLHFVDQVDVLEKWLDGYSKATTKLAAELSTIDGAIGNYLSFTAGPPSVSEAAVDHDYALLAVRRCGDTFRDVWAALAGATRKLDTLVTEPIKTFINGDLKNFKVNKIARPTYVKLFEMATYTSSRKFGARLTNLRGSTIICILDSYPILSRKNPLP